MATKRIPIDPWQDTAPRSERVVSAIARIAQVLRNGAWQFGTAEGLNPAQVDVLELLRPRGDAVRLSWIATQLRISNASASDSIAALVAKGLIEKTRAADDARALALRLSADGQALAARISGAMGFAHQAVEALPDQTQDALYAGLLGLIGQLQQAERFPELRACVSCRHFVANKHADPARPHHCQLINAPLPVGLLRLDCPEHEPAEPALARVNRRELERV
jgi:DNA-binding MarR family transcriptional regulator